jgi:hypothetical protein
VRVDSTAEAYRVAIELTRVENGEQRFTEALGPCLPARRPVV